MQRNKSKPNIFLSPNVLKTKYKNALNAKNNQCIHPRNLTPNIQEICKDKQTHQSY